MNLRSMTVKNTDQQVTLILELQLAEELHQPTPILKQLNEVSVIYAVIVQCTQFISSAGHLDNFKESLFQQ